MVVPDVVPRLMAWRTYGSIRTHRFVVVRDGTADYKERHDPAAYE